MPIYFPAVKCSSKFLHFFPENIFPNQMTEYHKSDKIHVDIYDCKIHWPSDFLLLVVWKKQWELSSERHLRTCFPKATTQTFCWERFIRYVYKIKVQFGHALIVSQSILQYWRSYFWVPVWEPLAGLLGFLLNTSDPAQVSRCCQCFPNGCLWDFKLAGKSKSTQNPQCFGIRPHPDNGLYPAAAAWSAATK